MVVYFRIRMSTAHLYLRDSSYKCGTELEVQSVRDILTMAPATIGQLCDRTGMHREKVIDCMKVLIQKKVLVRTRNKYSILKD